MLSFKKLAENSLSWLQQLRIKIIIVSSYAWFSHVDLINETVNAVNNLIVKISDDVDSVHVKIDKVWCTQLTGENNGC